MPSHASSRLLLAALAMALLAPGLRADPIWWEYSAFVFPGAVAPDEISGQNPPGGPGSVRFIFQGASGFGADTMPVTLAYTWTVGTLPEGAVATFKHQPVQVGLGILDVQSNRSELATFTAYLDGTVSMDAADLRLSFAASSKSLQIGNSSYKIDIGEILMPGAPGAGPGGSSGPVLPGTTMGSIAANVAATAAESRTPEPSTLLLVGVGGSVAGLLYCRRKKKAASSD